MNIYLVIITTALAVTQIVRCTQNAVQLRRQRILFEEQIAELAETEVTKEDFDIQRKAYRLIVEYLGHRVTEKLCEERKDNA